MHIVEKKKGLKLIILASTLEVNRRNEIIKIGAEINELKAGNRWEEVSEVVLVLWEDR